MVVILVMAAAATPRPVPGAEETPGLRRDHGIARRAPCLNPSSGVDLAAMKLRFAPSPTGLLHVGNARVALANWCLARQRGGRFLLRLDDTDTERSRPDFAAAIEEDLRWLGLDWDEFLRQSDRLDRYAAAAERLKARGRLYPCLETEEELAYKREQRIRQGKPPVYDRAALKMTKEQLDRAIANGKSPHWRFLLSGGAARS
jgi:glutamyl-tRNA synthetase